MFLLETMLMRATECNQNIQKPFQTKNDFFCPKMEMVFYKKYNKKEHIAERDWNSFVEQIGAGGFSLQVIFW